MLQIFTKGYTPDFEAGEIIIIDKDKGWSSFDVVNKIRFTLKHKLGLKKIKVGHAGTLDPLATGVLVICTGKATKTIAELQTNTKEYIATLRLGATTPSYDLETEIDREFDLNNITYGKIENILKSFVGKSEQTPPVYSAIWHKGKRAYEFARKGKEIELKKREIEISRIEMQEYNSPFLTMLVSCSTGTYIRSLAHDIGKALDNGAFLYYLRRVKSGNFSIDDAIKINEFEKIVNNL